MITTISPGDRFHYAPINVKPPGGRGGELPTGNWLSVPSPGSEFDMAAILEDRQKLEMSDLPSW